MGTNTVETPAIKKAMEKVHTLVTGLYPALLENADYMKLVEAGKGGYTGENSFVEVDGKRVGRICALTGAVFAHDNTDKSKSFFYKNGSYMIGAEIVKANARKEWEATQAAELQALEDAMMEGELTPKEWKEKVTEVNKQEFHFVLDDETKAQLIADFDGYPDKEAFKSAFEADQVPPFTDYAEVVEALRPKKVEEETTEEEA